MSMQKTNIGSMIATLLILFLQDLKTMQDFSITMLS